MIRTLIAGIMLVLFCILSIPLFAIEWVVGKISPRAKDISLLRIVQGACRLGLWMIGAHTEFIGRENIPKDRPVVYIANHRSLLDALLLMVCFPDVTGFLGKIELQKAPVIGWWLTSLHGYFLDRQDIRQSLNVILAGIEGLKNGISIAVFPEGTRGRDKDERNMLEFHEGTFKLSTKSGAPIIPVTICGSSALFEDHKPWFKSHRVIVEFGAPIDPASLTGDDRKFPGRYVRSLMLETMERNHARISA